MNNKLVYVIRNGKYPDQYWSGGRWGDWSKVRAKIYSNLAAAKNGLRYAKGIIDGEPEIVSYSLTEHAIIHWLPD